MDSYYGVFSNCPAASTTTSFSSSSSSTTPASGGGGGGNTCFHKNTVITYKGIERRLADFQAQREKECFIPHIVKATRGLHVAMHCQNSVTVLRLTRDHLVYTKGRGLVPAGQLLLSDELFSDLAETRPCPILYLEPEEEAQEYFGLNCISSEVLANGIKTSTFGKYHQLPSAWMALAGRMFGVERVSKMGDYLVDIANKWNLF